MVFELTILGSSSATPAYQRNPAAQVLNIHERLFLIDCGEATQIQLTKFKVKFHRINHVFISHLHGDHYLGLMGLLSTLHLTGRTNELFLYCHQELKEVIDLELKISETQLRFPIRYHFFQEEDETIFEDDAICIKTIQLNHRIPCKGFIFLEKSGLRNLLRDKIVEYSIPVSAIPDIKKGNDFVTESGEKIKNNLLTSEPRIPRSYAYCSDTKYSKNIIPKIAGMDLLYHEATFLHDLLARAEETFHTTSLQAGQIAKEAKAVKLIIGHFSARYKDLNPLLEEARSVFSNAFLALEGEKYPVD